MYRIVVKKKMGGAVPAPARPRRKGIARERWGFQGAASPWSEHSAEAADCEEGWFRRGQFPLRPRGDGWSRGRTGAHRDRTH